MQTESRNFVTIRRWDDGFIEHVADGAIEFEANNNRIGSKNIIFYSEELIKDMAEWAEIDNKTLQTWLVENVKK